MNLLLHCCCGPCTIYPLEQLLAQGFEVTLHFYNPNIHPYQEFQRRLDAFIQLAEYYQVPTIIDESYGLDLFLSSIPTMTKERCRTCYQLRMRNSISMALSGDFSSFSTTLLYSRYQNHQEIVDLCSKSLSGKKTTFVYQDFRLGWQDGIVKSKALSLYRQPYCGCIFSEYERYSKSKPASKRNL